ncbi:hypothetical protein ACYOEI_36745, partial [Singulisphaera rosea]
VPTLVGLVAGQGRVGRALAAVLLLGIAAERGVMYAWTAYQMKVQTAEVEMGNRAKLGLWLKTQMREGETLYLEPVGYIGYFSGARIRDWPGLVAPQVSELAKRRNCDFYTVVPPLKPDWIVLRPWEAQRMVERIPGFQQGYVLANRFDINAKLRDLAFLPGRKYLTNDAAFLVFRRRGATYRE